jgi:hypothetical protein
MVSQQQCHGDIRHYDRMGHNANKFSSQTLHALEGDPLDMSALKISLNQVLMLEVRRKRFDLSSAANHSGNVKKAWFPASQ